MIRAISWLAICYYNVGHSQMHNNDNTLIYGGLLNALCDHDIQLRPRTSDSLSPHMCVERSYRRTSQEVSDRIRNLISNTKPSKTLYISI